MIQIFFNTCIVSVPFNCRHIFYNKIDTRVFTNDVFKYISHTFFSTTVHYICVFPPILFSSTESFTLKKRHINHDKRKFTKKTNNENSDPPNPVLSSALSPHF